MTETRENFSGGCKVQNRDDIDMKILATAGVAPAELYATTDNIVAVAKALAQQHQLPVVSLPFCHTVEARALGADIHPADESAGPRAGAYVLSSPEQLPSVDLTADADILRLLEATRRLQQEGYAVAYQLSGPISILSCMMDLTAVFRLWRKQPQLLDEVFARLREMMLPYWQAACASGAAYLSYADPAGNADILGPKYSCLLTQQFTVPLLRQVQQLMGVKGYRSIPLLCPLTGALLGREGVLQKTAAGQGIFAVGCVKAGKDGFAPSFCIGE